MIDRDGSGTIDLKELQEHVNDARAFAQAFGPPREALPSSWSPQHQAIGLDSSDDDVPSRLDLKAKSDDTVRSQSGTPATSPPASPLVAEAEASEVQAATAEAEPAVAAVFNSIDLDGDGVVTKSEFRQFFQGDCTDVTLMNDVGVSWDEVKCAAVDAAILTQFL